MVPSISSQVECWEKISLRKAVLAQGLMKCTSREDKGRKGEGVEDVAHIYKRSGRSYHSKSGMMFRVAAHGGAEVDLQTCWSLLHTPRG